MSKIPSSRFILAPLDSCLLSACPNRAPSPTKKKEDDKGKHRSKDKSGATKEGADKGGRGREKNRTRRSGSSGSSRLGSGLKSVLQRVYFS